MTVRAACASGALLALLVVAPAAGAQAQTLITGAGRSNSAGFVTIRGLGDAARAVGRFRARDTFAGDLRGRVTCVAPWQLPGYYNVGGVLDRPVVVGGHSYRYFAFQLIEAGNRDYARTQIVGDEYWRMDVPCAFALWFDAFWQANGESGLVNVLVRQGNFVVRQLPGRAQR